MADGEKYRGRLRGGSRVIDGIPAEKESSPEGARDRDGCGIPEGRT